MGREFIELFEDWANYYDATVSGQDVEYMEVFRGYEDILKDVANKAIGNVLEFGVGTGNLTQHVLNKGLTVYGVEPSPSMREIAEEKLSNHVKVMDGDFLQFPPIDEEVHSIVSSYAFHHLTDEEKEKAIELYSNMLSKNGKIVFADTMFEDKDAYQVTITHAEKNQFLNLAEDLKTEYYTTIPVLKQIVEKYGFSVQFTRFNHFVWVMEATKN